MRQGHSSGDFDDFDDIEDFQNFSDQKFQNFSNSKFANMPVGIIISNNDIANSNKQSKIQSKSKIAKKSDKVKDHNDQTREPLKSTNKQTNPKKKNQEVKLHGSVIQKVDYPRKVTQKNQKTDQLSKVEKESSVSKSTSLDQSSIEDENKNTKKNKIQSIKNNENNKNDEENDDHLQIIATKFSKFLQEIINSHQHLEIQAIPIDKSKKSVTYEKTTTTNNDDKNQKIENDNRRPKLSQSATQSIERPEVQSCAENCNTSIQKHTLGNKQSQKDQLKKENRTLPKNNVSRKNKNREPKRRRRSGFDSYSETDSDNDSIGSFDSIEPKVPPKPIEHMASNRNEKNVNNNKTNDPIKELIRKKNELDKKINNSFDIQRQQEIELDSHFSKKTNEENIESQTINNSSFSKNDSLIPRIEQIQNSLNTPQVSIIKSESQSDQQLSKEFNGKNDLKDSNSINLISNCIQLNPSNFVPQRRLFNMSSSDSDCENELLSNLKSEVISEKKSLHQLSGLINQYNKNENVPRSPHVTWDISNCPPIRPKASSGFNISKSFSFINYDEINGYVEEKDAWKTESNQDNNEIDLNSPINFSKAIKLPKNFLNEFNADFNNEEEEDMSENIPNYSRILSILNKKLDESQYNEVVNIMNKYKVKHFCLLISMLHQNIQALYLLRSDLSYAKIIWGEGLTKVYKDDVDKFFTINIASRRFEPMKITDFACDVDAFTVD